MSNKLRFFGVAGADRRARGAEEIGALTAAEIDHVAGAMAKVCIAGSDGTLVCRPVSASDPK